MCRSVSGRGRIGRRRNGGICRTGRWGWREGFAASDEEAEGIVVVPMRPAGVVADGGEDFAGGEKGVAPRDVEGDVAAELGLGQSESDGIDAVVYEAGFDAPVAMGEPGGGGHAGDEFVFVETPGLVVIEVLAEELRPKIDVFHFEYVLRREAGPGAGGLSVHDYLRYESNFPGKGGLGCRRVSN